MSMIIGLPKLQALCLRDKHLVAFFHAKGLVPHVDMRQGSVHTPAAQCVGVALGAVADFGLGDVAGPYSCIGNEEALVGSEAVDCLLYTSDAADE